MFPNCTAKPKGGRQVYVGDQLLDSRDISQLSLRRPIDRVRAPPPSRRARRGPAAATTIWLTRAPPPSPPLQGFLVNYELQRDIWARAFKSVLQVDPSRCALVLTEPLFNFPQVQAATEQVRRAPGPCGWMQLLAACTRAAAASKLPLRSQCMMPLPGPAGRRAMACPACPARLSGSPTPRHWPRAPGPPTSTIPAAALL